MSLLVCWRLLAGILALEGEGRVAGREGLTAGLEAGLAMPPPPRIPRASASDTAPKKKKPIATAPTSDELVVGRMSVSPGLAHHGDRVDVG